MSSPVQRPSNISVLGFCQNTYHPVSVPLLPSALTRPHTARLKTPKSHPDSQKGGERNLTVHDVFTYLDGSRALLPSPMPYAPSPLVGSDPHWIHARYPTTLILNYHMYPIPTPTHKTQEKNNNTSATQIPNPLRPLPSFQL